jgi:hypothetical protein
MYYYFPLRSCAHRLLFLLNWMQLEFHSNSLLFSILNSSKEPTAHFGLDSISNKPHSDDIIIIILRTVLQFHPPSSPLSACCTHPQIPGVRGGSRHSIRFKSSQQPNCVIIWDNNHETWAYQYSNAQTRIRAVRRKHKRVWFFLPLWWLSLFLSTVCYCVLSCT